MDKILLKEWFGFVLGNSDRWIWLTPISDYQEFEELEAMNKSTMLIRACNVEIIRDSDYYPKDKLRFPHTPKGIYIEVFTARNTRYGVVRRTKPFFYSSTNNKYYANRCVCKRVSKEVKEVVEIMSSR